MMPADSLFVGKVCGGGGLIKKAFGDVCRCKGMKSSLLVFTFRGVGVGLGLGVFIRAESGQFATRRYWTVKGNISQPIPVYQEFQLIVWL